MSLISLIKDKAKSASDESEKEPYIFIRRPSRDCLHILFCFSLRNIRVLFTETPKKTIAWAWNRRGDRIRNTFQHNHHRHLSRKIHKRSSFALHSFFSVCVPVDRCTGMRSVILLHSNNDFGKQEKMQTRILFLVRASLPPTYSAPFIRVGAVEDGCSLR